MAARRRSVCTSNPAIRVTSAFPKILARRGVRFSILSNSGSAPGVYAAVAAGLAPHFHARERRKLGLQALPDPHRDVFQARDLETIDFVQVLVVEPRPQRLTTLLHLAQVGDESRFRIDPPEKHDARDEGMPVQSVIRMTSRNAGKAVRRVEREFLVNLHSIS